MIAITYTMKMKKKKNKGSQMGHTKKNILFNYNLDILNIIHRPFVLLESILPHTVEAA
jgi:hypothetical protein